MNEGILTKFGFKFGKNTVHTSRTIMIEELKLLLEEVPSPKNIKQFIKAIEEDNCLGKRSAKNRNLTSRHLIELYSLDPDLPLFRTMLYFWNREKDARVLLALLCTISRDNLFRSSLKIILSTPESKIFTRKEMEEFIEDLEPGRFSKATLKSVAQNINSSWTKSGHLTGRVKKIRTEAKPTPASVSYALYLGYLYGVRGLELFDTDFIKIMDCSREKAIELTERASQRGWIVFKHIGNVMELAFPNLITKEEAEWLREQN